MGKVREGRAAGDESRINAKRSGVGIAPLLQIQKSAALRFIGPPADGPKDLGMLFCRKTQPVLLGFALRAFSKIKRTLLPSGKRQPAGLVGSA